MPSGRVHHLATMITGAAVGTLMQVNGFPTSEIVALEVGFFATFFINPDLDLNTTFPKRNPRKWLWWLYWYPYSRLFPHRSALSHFPLLGTFVRIAYLLVPLYLLQLVSDEIHIIFAGATFPVLGMVISDTVHYLMDITVTAYKRSHYRNIRKS